MRLRLSICSRMQGGYPYVPIGNAVRLPVAIFSYLDTFSIGVTADYDAAPDLDVLVAGIGRSLAALRPGQEHAAR